MKNVFLGTAVMALFMPQIVWAECISYSSCSGCTTTVPNGALNNCNSVKPQYYGVSESGMSKYNVTTCDTCKPGWKLGENKTLQLSPSCTVQYRLCDVSNCVSCSNCTSDASWSTVRKGYEKKVIRTCNCDGTCSVSTQYRCAPGYYGNSINGTSGCTACPSEPSSIYGTSTAGSTSITSCYIPTGTFTTDSKGTFAYRSNCYYTN